ncbi:MAG: hypothetical protein FWF31_09570 [Desulfobulbus sp.]|nr:hypothetical protein [Desulfobulbus sp.]
MQTSLTSIHAAGRRLMVATACAALLLSGCAGVGPTTGHYYPECNTYCANVSAQANNTQLIKSVGAGAAVGALGGAAVGYLAGRNTTSTLVGAGVGAVVGGTAGYAYFQNKLKEYQDPRQRYQSYMNDAATQKQATLALQRDVIAARNCYDQKWKEVIAQFDSGAITKDEAEKRLKEIHAGLEQVKTIIAETRSSISTQREQAMQAMQAERDLPQAIQKQQQTSQKQRQTTQNQRQGNSKAASSQQQLDKNNEMDGEQITKIEKHLDSNLTEQDQALSSLYHADKDRETRRQREASARALET